MKQLIKLTLYCLILMASNISGANTLADYQSRLQAELIQSKQDFQATQKQIAAQRGQLLKSLADIETEIIGYRHQLAGQTQAQDQAFVSIQTMEKQLNQWQEQNRYIHNLLVRHAGNHDGDPLALVQEQLSAIPLWLSPQWQPGDAIAANGALISGERLTIGPLMYLKQPAGLHLLQPQDGQLPAIALTLQYPDGDALPVDITGSRALRIASSEKSWWQRLELGGLWVYPILVMGVLALAMAIKKAWQQRKQPKPDCRLVADFLASGVLPEKSGWQLELIKEALRFRDLGTDALGDRLHQKLVYVKHRQDEGMTLIAATAAVAPLMGLLGTVSGMIQTFDMMNLFGNQDSSLLSGGISEALVTTELGLVVAIPALLTHAWLNRRHQGLLNQLEADALLLTQLREHSHAR